MKNIIIITLFILGMLMVSSSTLATELERVVNLRGSWKFSIGDNKKWSESNYDDSNWDNIYAPGAWENEGYFGYDGYAWYRKSFNGDDVKDVNNLFILAGYIDDSDQVYINGQLIGFSGGMPPKYATAFNAKRMYYIPKGIVKAGKKNVIAIRVYDDGGAGGIVHGRIGLYKTKNDVKASVDLQGVWKFKVGNNADWKKKYWNDEKWETILAPSLWRNVGYWKLDGFAWYRKTFFLEKKFINEDLYLVLGKIDDFDDTYLNGQFVGRTNDGKRFGNSRSFQKIRIYALPKSTLTYNGYNTVAIRVNDLGVYGGMYEGPIGIFTESQLKSLDRYKNY